MKLPLVAFAASAFLTGVSPAQFEASPRAASIEVRICQVDLDVALKHYEKLQTMLRETRLERDLQGSSLGPNNPEVELTTRKMEVIQRSLAELKVEIQDLSARLEKTAPRPSSLQTR